MKAFFLPSGLCHTELSDAPSQFRNGLPDQGVDRCSLNVIQLLDCLLDVPLVGLDVADEDERVVVFDFSHGGLGAERLDDSPVLAMSSQQSRSTAA